MSVPKKDEVEKFMSENESFFMTPINNQKTFADFYIDNGLVNQIRDYSEQLETLLYKHKTITDKGIHREARAVIGPWRKGDFKPALEFDEIRQFLIANKDHPAIKEWRQQQEKLAQEVKAAEELGIDKVLGKHLAVLKSSLAALKEKQQELVGRNEPLASNAAKTLYNSLVKVRNDFAGNTIDYPQFSSACIQAIKTAKTSELANNRGFERWVKSFLNNIINCGVALLTFGQVKNVNIIKFSKPKSLGKVEDIETALNGLNKAKDAITTRSDYANESAQKALLNVGLFKPIKDDAPVEENDLGLGLSKGTDGTATV